MLAMPSAFAQDADAETRTGTGGIYVGDEPNQATEVCVLGVDSSTARTTWADPSACSEDKNNEFAAAMASTSTGHRILQVRMKQTTGGVDQRMWDNLLGGNHFMAGSGNFQGWFGTWADLNGDKFITLPDPSNGDAAIVVSADSGRPCAVSPNTAGSTGLGKSPNGQDTEINVDDGNDNDDDEVNNLLLEADVGGQPGDPTDGGTAGPEAHVGVTNRCDEATEWVGITDATVVLYVTPGEFTDMVNGPLGYELAGTSTPGKRNPDYTMTDARNSDDTEAATDGFYVAPAAGFEQIWTDNGLIQTTITEAIGNAVFEPDSGRAYSHRTGLFDHDNNANTAAITVDAVTDSDRYVSVNPAVEALYNTNVQPIWNSNPLGFSPDSWGVLSGSEITFSTIGGAGGTTVGGQFSSVVPVRAQEFPTGRTIANYGSFAGYLRVWMDDSLSWAPAVALAGDAASYRTEDNMNFGLYGALGVWRDNNGDGWLGTPPVPTGCADAHACGMVQDPNNYFAVKTNNEFFETCANGNSMPPATKYHWFGVEMTPSGGSWGPVGLYVLSDNQRAAANPAPIRDRDYETDSANAGAYNQYSFNPWDDVVYDVAGIDDRNKFENEPDPAARAAAQHDPTNIGTPGQVDRLVTSGAVTVHMVCTFYSGTPYYSSYEHYVLPGGNQGFSISLEAEDVEFNFQGFLTETLDFSTTIPPF